MTADEGMTTGGTATGGTTTGGELAAGQRSHAHHGADVATVEAVVRAQLARALGGARGILEAAVPTAIFTVSWLTSQDLRLSLVLAVAASVVLLAVRLLTGQTAQFVLNSVVGIAIAAVFALRSGRAEDAFLPGILYNGAYAVVLAGSVLVRWPVIGLMVGSVTGDPTGWRADPAVVRLTGRLTLVLALPCVLRVLVEWPLWAAGAVGWLGVAKIALGWPLQVAAFAAMAWLLARGRTPLARASD